MNMKDKTKLILIAQTYSYLKGEVNCELLFNFIRNNNFNFNSELSCKQMGAILHRSDKFIKTDTRNHRSYYKAI